MKIVHYIPGIDRADGGTATYMQTLAKYLGMMAEVHICTHESRNPVEVPNAQVHYFSSSLKRLADVKKQWLDLMDSIKPDVVHVNCCWLPLCSLVQKWSQNMDVKVVLSPHGMLEPWIVKRNYWTKKLPALLLYQKEAIKSADLIHATAESEKGNILRLKYNDKIAVVPNSVDLSEIKLKDEWSRKRQALFLSRVHVKKGVELLIDAVTELREGGECLDVSFVVAGEGEKEYREGIQRRIEERGLRDVVKLVGGIYGEQKWMAYRNADVFVLPTFSENFGIAIAEALASGTPVITTQGTPWKDLETDSCGCWIKTDVKSLADALRKMFSLNEVELKTLGINARRLIERKYSAEQTAKQMLELYESLM